MFIAFYFFSASHRWKWVFARYEIWCDSCCCRNFNQWHEKFCWIFCMKITPFIIFTPFVLHFITFARLFDTTKYNENKLIFGRSSKNPYNRTIRMSHFWRTILPHNNFLSIILLNKHTVHTSPTTLSLSRSRSLFIRGYFIFCKMNTKPLKVKAEWIEACFYSDNISVNFVSYREFFSIRQEMKFTAKHNAINVRKQMQMNNTHANITLAQFKV